MQALPLEHLRGTGADWVKDKVKLATSVVKPVATEVGLHRYSDFYGKFIETV